jgi:hypothetical protein
MIFLSLGIRTSKTNAKFKSEKKILISGFNVYTSGF